MISKPTKKPTTAASHLETKRPHIYSSSQNWYRFWLPRSWAKGKVWIRILDSTGRSLKYTKHWKLWKNKRMENHDLVKISKKWHIIYSARIRKKSHRVYLCRNWAKLNLKLHRNLLGWICQSGVEILTKTFRKWNQKLDAWKIKTNII